MELQYCSNSPVLAIDVIWNLKDIVSNVLDFSLKMSSDVLSPAVYPLLRREKGHKTVACIA